MSNPAKHHYLITAAIMFTAEGMEQINRIEVNGVLLTDEQHIPAAQLGKAQQIVQLNFHQRMGDEKVEVRDVVITGLSYLGLMTQEQFHKAPEGTKLQERAPAPASNEPTLKVVAGTDTLEEAVAAAGVSTDATSTEG